MAAASGLGCVSEQGPVTRVSRRICVAGDAWGAGVLGDDRLATGRIRPGCSVDQSDWQAGQAAHQDAVAIGGGGRGRVQREAWEAVDQPAEGDSSFEPS